MKKKPLKNNPLTGFEEPLTVGKLLSILKSIPNTNAVVCLGVDYANIDPVYITTIEYCHNHNSLFLLSNFNA